MLKPLVRIVDDEESVRDSISFLVRLIGLESESFACAEDFLNHGISDRPGCLILDIRMPGMSGLDLQDELVKRSIDLPILFLTGHGDVPTAVLAMKHGAQDFMQKPVDPELLQKRVAFLVDSHCRLSEKKFNIGQAQEKWNELTSREKETAVLVSQGLLNKVVADRLGIGIDTVKKHRASLMRKLDIKTSVALRDFLMKNHLINSDE